MDSKSIVIRCNSKGRLVSHILELDFIWSRRQRFLETSPGRQLDFMIPLLANFDDLSHIPNTSFVTPSPLPYKYLEAASYPKFPLIYLSQGHVSFDYFGKLATSFSYKVLMAKRDPLTPLSSLHSSTSSLQVVVIPTL